MTTSANVKRVLVTGGAGFIGSILVRLILNAGYQVNVLDSFLYEKDSLKDLGDALTIINGDTRNSASVDMAMEGADAVVHLAEIVGDPACDVDTTRARAVNLHGTQIVANCSKKRGIRDFIYMSSCSVYGLTDGDRLYSEEDTLNPVSLYASLKVEAEQFISSLSDETFAPTILRLSTVFGTSFRPRYDLLVNTLVARAITRLEIIIQWKDNWRPFIHVVDVGRVILAILRLSWLDGYRIFNVGHQSQNFTILDVANKVHERIQSATFSLLEQAPSDRRSYRVDFSKLIEAINFSPSHDVSLGIEELIANTPVDINYIDPMYSNVEFAKKIRLQNDPSRVVTMRTEATIQRYREDTLKGQQTVDGCRLCAISESADFPPLRYWRVCRNQYPYDKVAEISWILMPRRCVSDWNELTTDEQREYREFRLIAGDYGVNIFMWSTPGTQSIPGHFHEHLLRLYRDS